MEKIKLNVQHRDVVGKNFSKERAKGIIPAVMYGHKIAAQNLWVDLIGLKKVHDKAGESAIIELSLDEKKGVNVLIHDYQIDPLSGMISHVDFFQVRMDEELETKIPVEFIGESQAVKEAGGILVKQLDELPVSCLPAHLPEKFEVDISALATFDDRLMVSDIHVSKEVKVLIPADTVVALVTPPRAEEELAKLDEKAETDVSKVEKVEKEQKPAEDAEAQTPEEK